MMNPAKIYFPTRNRNKIINPFNLNTDNTNDMCEVAEKLPTSIITNEFFRRAEAHIKLTKKEVLYEYEKNLTHINRWTRSCPELYASAIYKCAIVAYETGKVTIEDISNSTKKIIYKKMEA